MNIKILKICVCSSTERIAVILVSFNPPVFSRFSLFSRRFDAEGASVEERAVTQMLFCLHRQNSRNNKNLKIYNSRFTEQIL